MKLYEDPGYTFWFSENRVIDRFHLDGQLVGRRVSVHALDHHTGQPRQVLLWACVGPGGWVELAEPLVVRAGDGFLAFPHLTRPD